jgi:hypothetical protein
VFERYKLHPEADESLERHGGLARQQLTQWRAFTRLLRHTDVFHFYFGLHSYQIPAIPALAGEAQALGDALPRLRHPRQAARPAGLGAAGDARIVGSYDAIRWVPDAEVVPPGIDLREYVPRPPTHRDRTVVVHAPSSRRRKGTST